MGRFVKHSDVQTLLLPGLGLPHIDLAYAHSVDDAEVIADEDEELQDGAIPIADVAGDDRVGEPGPGGSGRWSWRRREILSAWDEDSTCRLEHDIVFFARVFAFQLFNRSR